MKVTINSGMMELLEVLDRYQVKTSDVIQWMTYRLESLPEDIRDGVENIDEENREGEAERIESLTLDLNRLSWDVSYLENPDEAIRLAAWCREMDERIAQEKEE